ncbi:DUF6299 family protein [Streptomyces sp. NPDC051567]|uniref:DUF6299 family protein n=1 Tax=Streptomyces sp. NPDC051567 TaxID=3365660 RepID=UPI003788E210
MRIHGARTALAALSALAAVTLSTAPAGATVFEQGISVHPYAHISADGKVTLSGTYHCTLPSPAGTTMQISAAVVQGRTRVAFSGGSAVCDGAEHTWRAGGSLRYAPDVRQGRARAEARLQEIRFSGLLPSSVDTVAQDGREIVLPARR